MSPNKPTRYTLTSFIVICFLTALMHEGRTSPVDVAVPAVPGSTERDAYSVPLPVPGTLIRRELSAGDSHRYQITLDAGQYLHSVVEQQGIDVILMLYGPDGRLLVQFDCLRYGPTPVSLVAEASGLYRLEVRASERWQDRGHYELKVKEVRPAAARDRHRIIGEKTFAEGEQLLREWRAESSRKAIDKFNESASSSRAAHDVSAASLALKRIGDTYQTLGEFSNALAHYNQALALSKEANGGEYRRHILSEIGRVYFTTGENQKALSSCTEALRLSQAANDRRGEALALNYLGDVYYGFGNLQRSLQHYQKALLLSREIGYTQGVALALLNHGYTYSELSKMKEAIGFYNQALGLWQSLDERRWQAVTLTAIGRLYSRLGENQDSLNFFLRGRQLIQAIGDPVEEASILSGIAYVYDQLNEKQKSLWYYEQALALFRAARHFKAQANTLYDMGSIYYAAKRYGEALNYYRQGLAISEATSDRREQAYALKGVGTVYYAQQEPKKALGFYSRALHFFQAEKDLRGETDTINLIGRAYEERGQRRKALDYYQRAVSLSRKAEYPYGEAATLHNVARMERDSGNLAKARAHAEEALRVVESLRGKIDRQDLRASYFASVRQQYEVYVDLLMRLHHESPSEGFDAAAFEASERARARSLLETLSAARVGDRREADPALLAREASLRKELNEWAERRARLKAGGEPPAPEVSVLDRRIDELTWQLHEVEAQIRVGSLEHTTVLQAQPLNLKAIQERILDEDTLLLEYALGEERSYLWLVAKDALHSYELPARARIEEAANRVRSLLAAPAAAQGETFAERQARARENEEQYWREAEALSEMLLAPVRWRLGTKRLLVVADGALQYVPFNALPIPGRGGEQTPLIVEHEVTAQPSASVLATLRAAAGNRHSAAKAVAVFADPVFEADDARLRGLPAESADAQPHEVRPHQVSRDATTWEGGSIPRLIGSREEAEAILSIVSGADNLKAVGFAADKAAVTSPELGQFGIIHFATHGVLDSEHPELSGLLLSRFDSTGRPKESLLRLDDIFNLSLRADLVVLSACNSGLGKDVKGEGLIGLVRGFMYAGTPRVVASLWKVDDEATAELMTRFYSEMLQAGKSPASALREAQVSIWRQRRWRMPYYWAAFVLQGEYGGRIDAGLGHGRGGAWQTSAASLFGALCCLYVWRRRARKRRIHEH